MLIAMDMDGTLMRNDKSVSDRTREVLLECRRRGHRVMLATGRPPILQGLRYTGYPEPFWDAGIYCNGAQVFVGGDVLEEHLMAPDQWTAIYRALANSGTSFRFAANPRDGSVICSFPLNSVAPHYTVFRDVADVDLTQPVSKVFVHADEYWTIERLVALTPAGCRHVVLDGGRQVNFFLDGLSKAKGVEAVARYYGMSMADVIAFGDDRNDLEMLHAAGMGVAMGNAYSDVLAEIPLHTGSNEEDGIAQFLEKHLLGGKI